MVGFDEELVDILRRAGVGTLKESAMTRHQLQNQLDEFNTVEQIAAFLQKYTESVEIGWVKQIVYRVADLVIEWDQKDTYPQAEDLNRFIADADVRALFPDAEEEFNKNFWDHTGVVFHATTPENVESINKYGLNPGNRTRGITNRSVGSAVFTTTNKEYLLTGSYGTEIFQIDIHQMALDGLQIWAEQEPDIFDNEYRRALASALESDPDGWEAESGMDADTVILYGAIPPKYLTLLTNESRRARGQRFAQLVERFDSVAV